MYNGNQNDERPLYSERLEKTGYVVIKISNNPHRWIPKHRYVCEMAYGKIPQDCCITFRDGNKSNCSLENLVMCKKTELYKLLEKRENMDTKEKEENENHYKHGDFETIDLQIATQGVEDVKAFCICNAIKYLHRHKKKNGVEDIKKAKWYIDKYLELTKN